MKKYKSLAALLLGFLLSAALFPMQALAAGSIDLNRDASLTITEKYGETPLSGVRFDLYLVSTVDETGELTPEPAFEQYAAELDIRGQNDSAWQAMAEKLERESRNMREMRRKDIRKRIHMIDSKMIVPMIVMLFSLMLITVAPAMMSF